MLSFAAFAESSDRYGCSGKISGTAENVNTNAGTTNFDSHPQAANEGEIDGVVSSGTADGTILGIVDDIVAPGNPSMSEKGRELAACAELDGVDGDSTLEEKQAALVLDTYTLKGYVWNTNLGFINLYCGVDGNNIVGQPCGDYDYEVTVGPMVPFGASNIGGGRVLSGHAWNSAFGYIDFNVLNDLTIGDGTPTGSEEEKKKVYMDLDGMLHGYAWTEAGVWINFEGATVSLDGSIDTILVDKWCDEDHTKRVCIEIEPNPASVGSLGVGLEGSDGAKIADGEEGYLIKLYLSDPVTQDYVDIADISDFKLIFNWKDTVKKNQLSDSDENFDDQENPWAQGTKSDGGAIKSKPTIVTSDNFNNYFKKVVVGEYVLKESIASYAPTSNMNTSFTTSTTPPYSVRNDVFFNDEDGLAPSSNTLSLMSVNYELTYPHTVGEDYAGTVQPNGRTGLSLKFRPAIFMNTLYANGRQDTVDAMRNFPIRFSLGLETVGSLVKVDPLDFIKLVLTPPTGGSEGCDAFDFEFLKSDGEIETNVTSKSFKNKDSLPGILSAVASLPDVSCEQDCSVYEPGQKNDDSKKLAACLEEKDTCAACSFAGNAGIHSIVHYQVGGAEGRAVFDPGRSELISDENVRDVYYYSNKLPRISSSIANPVAVIHGNIYAPKVFSPSAAQKTQATGNVSIDVVRNTVNENVKTYLSEVGDMAGRGQTCTITAMKEPVTRGPVVPMVRVSDCNGRDYKVFRVGDENVLYFKDSDVVFPPSLDWDNKWAVIVDGGKVFIDGDFYHEGVSENLALVVMREEGGVCSDSNIYIDKNVKNLQVNIAADCSIFSYDSANNAFLEDGDIEGVPSAGLPDWDGFENMTQSLDNQLFIEGSIASRNTIGGADLDADGTDYLLLGTGRTVKFTQDERYAAQLYDLNYLRLFKLKLELSAEGLPVDQACGKALTVQDMIAISDLKAEIDGGNPFALNDLDMGVLYEGVRCDGINPLNKYSDEDPSCFGDIGLTECSGDLTVLYEDKDKLAEGLPPESYEPVYVHYKPSESFVFKKTSRTTTY